MSEEATSLTSRLIVAGSTVVALSLLSPGIAQAGEPACGRDDRGRLLGVESIASYPTPADARAYFESWVDFYRDFYGFAEDLTADVAYGFDAYKVTYCSIDAVLPGQDRAEPTVSHRQRVRATQGWTVAHGCERARHRRVVLRRTVESQHRGDLEPRGESFEGPASSPIFAGNGFIYVAPDLTGFGDSTVPRHRYFHADSEASQLSTCWLPRATRSRA